MDKEEELVDIDIDKNDNMDIIIFIRWRILVVIEALMLKSI